MVKKNPQLAKKLFPYQKRLGIEDYLNGTGEGECKHVKIDEKFLKKKLSKSEQKTDPYFLKS